MTFDPRIATLITFKIFHLVNVCFVRWKVKRCLEWWMRKLSLNKPVGLHGSFLGNLLTFNLPRTLYRTVSRHFEYRQMIAHVPDSVKIEEWIDRCEAPLLTNVNYVFMEAKYKWCDSATVQCRATSSGCRISNTKSIFKQIHILMFTILALCWGKDPVDFYTRKPRPNPRDQVPLYTDRDSILNALANKQILTVHRPCTV